MIISMILSDALSHFIKFSALPVQINLPVAILNYSQIFDTYVKLIINRGYEWGSWSDSQHKIRSTSKWKYPTTKTHTGYVIKKGLFMWNMYCMNVDLVHVYIVCVIICKNKCKWFKWTLVNHSHHTSMPSMC